MLQKHKQNYSKLNKPGHSTLVKMDCMQVDRWNKKTRQNCHKI